MKGSFLKRWNTVTIGTWCSVKGSASEVPVGKMEMNTFCSISQYEWSESASPKLDIWSFDQIFGYLYLVIKNINSDLANLFHTFRLAELDIVEGYLNIRLHNCDFIYNFESCFDRKCFVKSKPNSWQGWQWENNQGL